MPGLNYKNKDMTEEDKEYRQGKSKKQVETALALAITALVWTIVTIITSILIQ